jgi:hypothetical protein
MIQLKTKDWGTQISHKNNGSDSSYPEGWTVSALLVAPVVLLFNAYAQLRLLYAVLLSAKSMEFIKHQALIIVQS